MTRVEAYKLDSENNGFRAEPDKSNKAFVVKGFDSGFVYATYEKEGEAIREANRMNQGHF